MRIRTIKPDFWRSPDIVALPHFTRLLYVGLWNYVDDNGVGDDDDSLIRSDLFPRDPVDDVAPLIRMGLSQLALGGQIVRYEHEETERRYLKVTAWHHQKINRPTPSTKPLPSRVDSVLIDASLSAHGGLTEGSLLEGKGREGKGREGRATGQVGDEPRCAEHRDSIMFPRPPKCHDCREVRERRDTQRRSEKVAAEAERKALIAARANCPRKCDEYGRLEDLSPCPEHGQR